MAHANSILEGEEAMRDGGTQVSKPTSIYTYGYPQDLADKSEGHVQLQRGSAVYDYMENMTLIAWNKGGRFIFFWKHFNRI